MKGKILWKIILTALVFLWALSTIMPVKDTPFESFVTEQVRADNDGFKALMETSQARVKSGKAPSVFIALGQVANEEHVDVSKFFPQYKLEEVANLERRNGIMLRVLLRKSQGKLRFGLDLAGGVSVTFKANDSQLANSESERTSQMDKAREIITKRVDSLGVAEPIIRLKGTDAIEVQMPGVSTKDNPDIISTIGKPALLEFSTVNRTVNPRTDPVAPVGYRKMVEEREDPDTGKIEEIPYYIKSIPEMTGKSIASAGAAIGPYGGHLVSMTFTKEGAKRFADVTTRMADDNTKTGTTGQLAIILDGKLQSTPTVREPITGGSAQITGNFSQREAIDLANVLSNPLEVGLQVGEQNEVGSSLASGAKDASYMASVIGSLLVVAFMIFYYWGSGVVAVLAVALNILITIAGMCYFGATITLPGVAALVLTVGMAVDANILILERVREELRIGKNPMTALNIGYDKALATILDSNLTTMLTAVILAWLGTGPVKGFGVTLTIGILGTLFCALIFSQWVMELLVSKNLLKHIVGFEFFRESKFHFLNYRWPAFIGSWTIVAIGLSCVGIYWNSIFGVDFTGGDEVTMSYVNDLTVAEVTKISEMPVADMQKLAAQADSKNQALSESYALAISKKGFGEVNAVFTSVIGSKQMQKSLKIQTRPGMGLACADALTKAQPAAHLNYTGYIQIGPSVGKEVARSASISLVLAMLGIGLYVALRYEWGYGVGAVVATLHDGLMTIGMFVFLGEVCGIGSGQFTSSMIASILMVLGYSINDTIVVFDRIREELNLNPTMHLKEVIHLAINRTLSRTLLTSLTTFLATLALFIFAAGVVVDYALVFMIGIITGTFSSIFIAGTIFYWYHRGDRQIAEKSDDAPVVYEWDGGENPEEQN